MRPVSPAPKHAHRSPAQVRASRAWASAGRSAQARTRKAAIAKTGKPPPRSAQQKAASRAWASAGRSAQAARRAGKTPVARKKAALPALSRAHTLAEPGIVLWLPGCDEERPVCAVTAVANHLLAATGIIAADDEMLELHGLAGGDSGATIEDILDAAVTCGLAGRRLARFGMADRASPGTVAGLRMTGGFHAVLAAPAGMMISWGMVLPRLGDPEEAWWLDWEAAA
jgi:hypothetical protein